MAVELYSQMKIEKFNEEEYEVTLDLPDTPKPESYIRQMLMSTTGLMMGFKPRKKIDTVIRRNNSNTWIVTCK